jgi:hypothetical protein
LKLAKEFTDIMLNLDLDHLEQEGYTIVRGFLDLEMTRRGRAHIDSLLPPVNTPEEDRERWHFVLRHPIPGAIMADFLNNPNLFELATRCLQPNELRLLEQVLIRSDPRPPPHGPLGWHVDWAFFPQQYKAVPRQTYFHMSHCLNTVPPGGAAFMIVPGSHHLTYAATAKMDTVEELNTLRRDPAGVAGIDTSKGIEVCPNEGDLLIFNPMALHSGSGNSTDGARYVCFTSFFDTPMALHSGSGNSTDGARYVCFTSFFDTSATELWEEFRRIKYRDGFPDSLRERLPADLLPLLEW